MFFFLAFSILGYSLFQFLSKSARRMGLLSFVYLHFHVDEKIPFNRIHSK